MSRRVSRVSNCSRILLAMNMKRKRPKQQHCTSYLLLTRLLGLDVYTRQYNIHPTYYPSLPMDQFSLKPTTHKPVLYSYNICAVPRRLELENGINRRPNQNQPSVSSTTTTTVYLYQFFANLWHYFTQIFTHHVWQGEPQER